MRYTLASLGRSQEPGDLLLFEKTVEVVETLIDRLRPRLIHITRLCSVRDDASAHGRPSEKDEYLFSLGKFAEDTEAELIVLRDGSLRMGIPIHEGYNDFYYLGTCIGLYPWGSMPVDGLLETLLRQLGPVVERRLQEITARNPLERLDQIANLVRET